MKQLSYAFIFSTIFYFAGVATAWWFICHTPPTHNEATLPAVTLPEGQASITNGPVTIARIYTPEKPPQTTQPDTIYRHVLKIARNGPKIFGDTIVTDIVSSGGATGQFMYTEDLKVVCSSEKMQYGVGLRQDLNSLSVVGGAKKEIGPIEIRAILSLNGSGSIGAAVECLWWF